MSVTATTTVRYREFPGYADPALPLGHWATSALAVGDASGGNRVVIMEFNPATAPRSPLMYSLELITVGDDDNNDLNGALRVINLDPIPGLGAIALTKRWEAPLVAGISRGQLQPAAAAQLTRIFLGRQALAGVQSGIQYTTVNADLNIVTVTCEGYFWGPRSINAQGGPSRPLQGMYPS